MYANSLYLALRELKAGQCGWGRLVGVRPESKRRACKGPVTQHFVDCALCPEDFFNNRFIEI